VGAQPAGQRLGLAIGQDLDALAGFGVDQDGGVAVAAA
jgi:hypothetical protein